MSVELQVRVEHEDGFRCRGFVREHGPYAADVRPPLGGDAGPGGLEWLLLSLAMCSGQTTAGILKKMRVPFEGLEVRASGTKRDEHPTVLTAIRLEFVVRGKGLDAAAVEKAVRMSEEKYCPVWAMLKGGTPVSSTVRVAEGGAAG